MRPLLEMRYSLDLPLHTGKAPKWLFRRMVRMSQAILEIMFELYDSKDILSKFSDPIWFQSFGAVLGFDWHSSGLTTTVCAAIKSACASMSDSKLMVCGGKGSSARRTPEEIDLLADCRFIQIDPNELKQISKVVAKIDNSCIQDGFTLYHHCMFLDKEGNWAVIQQGMSEEDSLSRGMARRYHWYSEHIKNMFSRPHRAVISVIKRRFALNLVDSNSDRVQRRMVELFHLYPDKIVKILQRMKDYSYKLPRRHQVLLSDIDPKRIKSVLLSNYHNEVKDFSDLLANTTLGPKTLRSLALISDLIYSVPLSFNDPARFSYAVGGKDGHPYSIDLSHYDEVVESLHRILKRARVLGPADLSRTLTRLRRLTREQVVSL